MNATKKLETHNLDGGEFIRGESRNNPFARIACRNRIITPTPCDGTCGNCKKERNQFLETEPRRLQSMDIIASGGDAYYEVQPTEDYRTGFIIKAEKLQRIKQYIIEERRQEQALIAITEEKMHILQLRTFSPDISITLH